MGVGKNLDTTLQRDNGPPGERGELRKEDDQRQLAAQTGGLMSDGVLAVHHGSSLVNYQGVMPSPYKRSL